MTKYTMYFRVISCIIQTINKIRIKLNSEFNIIKIEFCENLRAMMTLASQA